MTLPRYMKTTIVHLLAGLKAAIEAFFVENPPVDKVEREWVSASKNVSPCKYKIIARVNVNAD